MVNYDYTYQLGAGEGDTRRANNLYVIAHDTANDNNQGPDAAKNEASFMKRNWMNAYTQGVAGHDYVYIVGEPGYVAYGALDANPHSPYQVELTHYLDVNLAKKAYANWINSMREMAKKYNIPLTLDAGGPGTPGVKTHSWVSHNLGGDHEDPWDYLARMGINFQQLENDIKNGVGVVTAKGWKYEGKYWFFYENGKRFNDGAKGMNWKKIADVWYLFDTHGAMYANTWKKVNGKWYFLSGSGGALKGWQIIKNRWYYFDGSCAMKEGWLKQGNAWYYMNPDGSMKTGWFQDKFKNWYYLSIPNGVMVTGTTVISNKTYQFDKSGKCLNP